MMIMMDDGIHYEDDFNDMSWSCSVGTSDDDGVWMNRADPAGTLMSACVWILFLYSAFTMSFLARTNGIPYMASYVYSLVVSLALACHVKTSLTDPGSVPASAVPTEEHRRTNAKLSMCTQCQSFKPPLSHHCRICNRCISRMDHHCPWMNNCTLNLLVGAIDDRLRSTIILIPFIASSTHSTLTHIIIAVLWFFFFCCGYGKKYTQASERAI
jgi:DHHC palmitoyltransferase